MPRLWLRPVGSLAGDVAELMASLALALGLALGTGVFALLQIALPDDAFESYGWRIAFLISIVLVIFGVVVRLKAAETPAFEKVRAAGERAAHPDDAAQVLAHLEITAVPERAQVLRHLQGAAGRRQQVQGQRHGHRADDRPGRAPLPAPAAAAAGNRA